MPVNLIHTGAVSQNLSTIEAYPLTEPLRVGLSASVIAECWLAGLVPCWLLSCWVASWLACWQAAELDDFCHHQGTTQGNVLLALSLQ